MSKLCYICYLPSSPPFFGISKFTNDLREKFEKEHKNHDLANKLLYGEIGPSELNEQEVDEMTEYFKKDIQNIDNELLRIKQHILYMQKELKKKHKIY